MKINRVKLNAMLRSGLNPAVSTRKQLAAHLNLDATSITRWFASTDSAGNPRYPVVPDRHVIAILQLFSLSPEHLQLSDEDFRQFCFAQAIAQKNAEEITQTQPHSTVKVATTPRFTRFAAFAIIALAAVGIVSALTYYFLVPREAIKTSALEQNLLIQAETNLSNGKAQLQATQYRAALAEFDAVIQQLSALASSSDLHQQAMFYKGLAYYGMDDWERARLQFQNSTLTADQIDDFVRNHEQASGARGAARGQIELGHEHLAFGYIQGAIDHDRNVFGENHPVIADDWLLLSHVLFLQNSFGEARLHAEKALQLDQQLFGEHHPRTAEDQMTLSLLALHDGEISRAYDLFAAALDTLRVAGLDLNAHERPEALILAALDILNNRHQFANTTDIANRLQDIFMGLTNNTTAKTPFVLKRLVIVLRREAIKRGYL